MKQAQFLFIGSALEQAKSYFPDNLRFASIPIIMLLLVMLFPSGPLKIATIQKAHGTSQSVSLTGYAGSGWKAPDGTVNPTITIPHGELFNLTSSSGDGVNHEFYVDVDGNGQRDYPIDPVADTGSTTLGYFAPGTYAYYCAIHPQTMHGALTVLPPPGSNFAITPNWWLSIIVHGTQSGSTTITVSSVNGFSGTVNLSPSAPAGITTALSKSTVSITPSVPATTILNLTAGASTPEGKYAVTLTGSDGTGSHTARITTLVYVADFQLSGTQNLPVLAGSSRTDTLGVISTWGFRGNITLAVAVPLMGPRVSLNTTRVSITPFRFAQVLIKVDAVGIGLGDYNVTITATASPSMSHELAYDVSVWSEPSSSSPRPVIDPSQLTIVGLLIFVIAVVMLDALRDRRRGKPSQPDLETWNPPPSQV